MNSALQAALREVITGGTLSRSQMHDVVCEIMDGQSDPIQVSGLLCMMAQRGETVDEIAGAATAMRERCTLIREQGSGLLDTCGTGGDGLHTFNISTATAIVCAASGVTVAKHGNRSVSSTSGSADVLEKLGVKIDLSPEQVNQCIDTVGIGFCFAPLLHQAMKHLGPVRKSLGVRTIFNLLGPLTNPARAEFQLIGTIRDSFAEKLAHALAMLGTTRAAIVCGNNEIDEVCLWRSTQVYLVEGDQVSSHQWTAATFGLQPAKIDGLQVQTAEQSAAMIQGVFRGEKGSARDIVLANAAAGLWVTGKYTDLKEATQHAAQSIDSGTAQKTLDHLKEFSA
ncbi:MAG: anthranilate phosphoribosyltransferase [Planctomycetaceae bacterium]|nr:anthranilate phosphoribosyltransferase [Planctomycetaceae bacterium]